MGNRFEPKRRSAKIRCTKKGSDQGYLQRAAKGSG